MSLFPRRGALLGASAFGRQDDLEDRATRMGRRDGEPAGMTLDNHPANRQAQSHAVRLRRNEGVEYAVHLARINSWAGIFDLHGNTIAVPFGGYLQRPLAVFDGVHG